MNDKRNILILAAISCVPLILSLIIVFVANFMQPHDDFLLFLISFSGTAALWGWLSFAMGLITGKIFKKFIWSALTVSIMTLWAIYQITLLLMGV